jgi:HD-like signal output (HDOD) protein
MNWTLLRERLLGDGMRDVSPPKLNIPPLPAAAMEFCRAADQPSATIPMLAQLLDRDAGLVVELLRNVNSSATGVRNRVSSTKAAIGLLGIRRTKIFVMTSSVQSVSQKSKSPFAGWEEFSYSAMQRAVFARRFAELRGLDADLSFSAALLQDFTIPALTAESPSRYKLMLQQLSEGDHSLADLERARTGWDHALAGARLMLSWQFPDDLVCLMLSHHWINAILNSDVLCETELLPVALSSLLPGPLDSRLSQTQLLEELLSTRFGVEVAPFRQWVMNDLESCVRSLDSPYQWTCGTAASPVLARA